VNWNATTLFHTCRPFWRHEASTDTTADETTILVRFTGLRSRVIATFGGNDSGKADGALECSNEPPWEPFHLLEGLLRLHAHWTIKAGKNAVYDPKSLAIHKTCATSDDLPPGTGSPMIDLFALIKFVFCWPQFFLQTIRSRT
jgi:hypothetical protein